MNVRRVLVFSVLWASLALLLSSSAQAQEWRSLGPEGGDVRLLVADPRNAQVLYLGTSDGHVFHSTSGGTRWELLSRIGERLDTVVMSLLVDRRDSKRLYAGIRTMKDDAGGLYRSHDGGRTWQLAGLRGQHVRAIAQSASRPDLFVAGTLEGVYRSADSGKSWERISPTGHADLLNFDSVAIDPENPDLIYAGTYHLAWKTSDGGRTWTPIHTGMIDDSDVMSISLDRWDSNKIFATACSGMYRSANRGDNWTKIRGVPPTARRTYFLHQDPRDPRTLYAGTTQGLWKSTDDGTTWKRVTSADWSAISLVIDPTNPNRLVVGIERRGVVVSDDAGATFRSSNEGFHHQQIMAFAADPERTERMLLVLTNAQDRVLATRDAGRTWTPIGQGFEAERVRRVLGAPGSWWASLSTGGLITYDEKTSKWVKAGLLEAPKTAPPAKSKAKKAAAAAPKPRPFTYMVNDLAFTRGLWLAATPQGIMASRDRGTNWFEFSASELKNTSVHSLRVSSDGKRLTVFALRGVFVSEDAGQTWSRRDLPVPAERVVSVSDLDDGTHVLVTRWGLFLMQNPQDGWRQAQLPDIHIEDAAVLGDTLLVSTHSRGLFASTDRGTTWEPVAAPVAEVRVPFLGARHATGGFVAASSTESLHGIRIESLRASRTAQRAGSAETSPQQTQARPRRDDQ
jgi:photosystem II stability/assembly factor-like uncharacterized protein